MEFQQINLIVGRNASGKSRTLNVINALAQALQGMRDTPSEGHFDLRFTGDSDNFRYLLEIEEGGVKRELYEKNGVPLLDRSEGGYGKIYAQELEGNISFQTPPGMLAATTRMDLLQHPFLLPLIDWAKGLFYYPCHTDLGKQMITVLQPDGPPINPKDANQTAGVLRDGLNRFGKLFEDAVIRDMGRIGYELTGLGLAAPSTVRIQGSLPGDITSIYVNEKDIVAEVDQFSMSMGMFRALAIVIHLNYSLLRKEAQCILIDDIGEGLDFDRSSNLIKLIIEKVQTSSMQIVMTTNDRYVMNGVDLQYWSVLDRQGPEVNAFNSKNRSKDFEDFRFTGLSNFDFIARDFLGSGQ
jgi:energy-coupling factor transporter ATP-binding protein EcfA2